MTQPPDQTDHRSIVVGCILGLLLVATWVLALVWAPTEASQGDAYRIMYLHVPSAFSAFASAAALCVTSILALKGRRETWLLASRSIAETGLIYTVATLATGSIWGRPIWGVWWTWDARLTTTLLLALLYGGYLLLFTSMPQGSARVRACAVLGILIFADVPLIYQSVNWWRTLHQPQSILRSGGSTMDSTILTLLLICVAVSAAFGVWLATARARNLLLRDELEAIADEEIMAG